MKIPFFQLDAFTDELFSGNPAIVLLLEEEWLNDDLLQKIVYENNLPATVFLRKHSDGYLVRWFTPQESDLCGHGSLAAAFVIFNFLEPHLMETKLTSSKGLELRIHRTKQQNILLGLPEKKPVACSMPRQINEALDLQPLAFLAYLQERCLIVVENEQQVRAAMPDLQLLAELPWWGYVLTASGDTVDFVSRTFYPRKKIITEDAVTGASHCVLTPYWSERLNKNSFSAKQLSSRGGILGCELQDNKVVISGRAVLYAKGELYLS